MGRNRDLQQITSINLHHVHGPAWMWLLQPSDDGCLKRVQGSRCNDFYNLTSEVTLHHFLSVLVVAQLAQFDVRGTMQEHEHVRRQESLGAILKPGSTLRVRGTCLGRMFSVSGSC